MSAADGEVAAVEVAGVELALVSLRGGGGSFDEESQDPGAFPPVEAGQPVEARVGGLVVLRGTLSTD